VGADRLHRGNATRVFPGSQIGDKKPTDYSDAECLQAEMTRGSVLIYSEKIVHRGAANRSAKVRRRQPQRERRRRLC